MKITIENDLGQKVIFHRWADFDTKIISLCCEECDRKDDVILSEHQNEILRNFLYPKEVEE